MNYEELTEKLRELKIEDFVWLIYIGIIFFSWIANSFERKYFIFNDEESREKYRTIMMIIFIILIIIYFYFLKKSIEDLRELKPTDTDKKKLLTFLSFLASLLIAISGIIILFIIISDEFVEVEIAFN